MWHGVQNMVAWGLEQNDPKLFKVSRYNKLMYNFVYEAQDNKKP
jgi:hypothetical protein